MSAHLRIKKVATQKISFLLKPRWRTAAILDLIKVKKLFNGSTNHPQICCRHSYQSLKHISVKRDTFSLQPSWRITAF